ncbi:MAG TPA: UvrD-helicase domain-containing protein [Planctomycetes bacterium]|nr:UvrD-helicase domain-containing protein [Planctomycetota bacterium]
MIKWTSQQKLAINSAGKEVLVTASAGTGKTAVLAERCANILADTTEATDISQILVLTFTNAAADEMQARIAENLRDRFQKNRNSFLRRQLLTLDAAHISTIHKFCRRIITDNFHLLGLDPTFGVIEQDEQGLLKSEILEEIIEQAWEDNSLAPGLSKLLQGRNIRTGTSGFLDAVIACSRFLDSIAGRNKWYERAAALADAAGSETSELAQKQKQMIISKLKQCKSQLEYSKLLDQKITHTGHWTDQIKTDFLEPVSNCIEYLQKDNLDRCADTIRNFVKPKFANKPKDMPPEIAELIKAPAKEAIETLKKIADLAFLNPDYEKTLARAASLQTRTMIELVKRFDRRYAEAKAKLNCLDFADLEHKMLKLLAQSDSTSAALRKRFKFIFVDEYQDINPVQQAILEKISRPDNVFVVGDIKQSIYAFRQAQPQIFLNRLRQATEKVTPLNTEAEPRKRPNTEPESVNTAGPNKKASPESAPLRVDLSGNFRSRKAVLDFANTVFGRIMTAPAFLVDYDEKTFLEAEFEYEPPEETIASKKPLVQMYILNEEPAGQNENNHDEDQATPGMNFISSTQRQAAFIAGKISEMVGKGTGRPEFKIYDKQTSEYRDVQYRDIVILMRSPAHRANQYVEMFQLAGIPVTSAGQAGYFAATEISDCLSLLKVLDNPQQDIELAAVLRSAFFKLTDIELAMLRKHGDSDTSRLRLSFYDCARKYSQNGPDLPVRRKLAEILEQIESWRLLARRQPLADFLWHIYRQTGFLSFVRTLPKGPQRKANLLKLHERAVQFENFTAAAQPTSLGRFVEFIEKLLEQGADWSPAEPDSLTENAVRIMSIHKSKGLEFPVVFVAELNCPFNKTDSYGDCLIDHFGLGLQIIDSNVKINTAEYDVIAENKLNAMLAEEMRILYVALTRARERLILTASKKANNCRNILAPLSLLPREDIKDWQLKSAKSHFEWLLYALANRKKLLDLFELESAGNAIDDDLFGIELPDPAELDGISDKIINQKHEWRKKPSAGATKINSQTRQLLDRVTESLNWKYPLDDLTKLPAKTSVSKLTHPADEFAKDDLSNAFERRPKTVSTISGYTGLIGTATHLVIQNLDLDCNITSESIRATAQRLVGENRILPVLAEKIDCDSIVKFFLSDLGKLVKKHKDNILREWPFTFAMDANILGSIRQGRTWKAPIGQTVILQGIIDMIIKTPAGLVIIDFKTDDVTADSAEKYAESRGYCEQMRYYTTAASNILKQQIVASQLYFLKPAVTVYVPNLTRISHSL